MEEDSIKGMISAISWVPRGAAKSVPVVADPPTQEEIAEAMKTFDLGRDSGSDADEDDDAATMELDEVDIFGSGLGDLYYPSNAMDPYLKKNNEDDEEDDDDDEEIEDKMIMPTDFVIVCAHSEDDIFSLQASIALLALAVVNILEETNDGEQNIFVHHDVPLADFPLCTAWMDFNLKGGEKGNFVAVGTMDPAIEIWDLDMVDEVQPHMVLGGLSKKKKKTKGKKGKKYKKGSHRSSVLGLAWNKEVRNVLASASADTTVKIWDIAVGKCAVQAVAWSPQSPEVLLSGSFDKTVAMNDMKDGGQNCHKWSVEADVESLAWNPHNEHSFVVSLENGMVQAFDKRTASSSSSGQSMYTLHAHDKAVSSISFNPSAPNGAIFSVSFSNDSPFLLACGGSKGKLKVWDTLTEPAVANKFSK
ncbi:Periodic tryptophan protein 1 [Zea mays]|uniref:Periodic tryptophan protein 1 n=1 Tax=Zea mays TaxID=4577 RepID=A0A1D6N2Q5_MAIZE|nr:Periodic tryptophan protein 1 [Zea mays]